MHLLRGQSEGAAPPCFLRHLTTQATYQMVTRFFGIGESPSELLHLCMHEKQTQTDGANYRSLKRHRARFDQRLPRGRLQRALRTHPGVTCAGTLIPSDDLLLVDGDVGESSTANNLINSAEQRFGRVDVLINNAGIFVPKPFVEYTSEDFQRVVATNLAGFFYISQEAVRHMQQNGGGQIITITTTLAQQPVAGSLPDLPV